MFARPTASGSLEPTRIFRAGLLIDGTCVVLRHFEGSMIIWSVGRPGAGIIALERKSLRQWQVGNAGTATINAPAADPEVHDHKSLYATSRWREVTSAAGIDTACPRSSQPGRLIQDVCPNLIASGIATASMERSGICL